MSDTPTANAGPQPCSICGCKGLHACIGSKVHWSEEKIAELHEVLSRYEVKP